MLGSRRFIICVFCALTFSSVFSFDAGGWETLELILPDQGDTYGAGKFCYNYTSYYCLHGYWFDQIQSGRTPQDDDVEVWTNLIEPEWQKLNWFSFDSRSLGTCCNSQVHEYMSHGSNYGVSPQDYYDKVTNFSNSNKVLNRIKVDNTLKYEASWILIDYLMARYDKDSAVNVLSEIGFGIGDLQVDGAKIGMDYVFPPKMKVTMTVDYDDPRKQITFDWFKSAVMCKAQPWICQNPNKVTSTS